MSWVFEKREGKVFAQGHLVGSGNPGSQADRRLPDGKFMDYMLQLLRTDGRF